ncbi:MAG: amidohydrolase family protein [Myxococcota bacterium]
MSKRARLLIGVVTIGALAALGYAVLRPEDPTPDPPSESTGYLEIGKIDVHTHLAPSSVEQTLRFMDAHGISVALNASGGTPQRGLHASAAIARQTGGRIRPYCNLSFRWAATEDFPRYVNDTLRDCKALGGVGIKISKALGLGVLLEDGSLLAVDDPRLDPLFAMAGELRLPILIHTGDPKAFFEAPTPDNERYAELQAHPSWSFYGPRPDGGEWPSWEDLFRQFEHRVARHPETTFVGAHFGNAPEDPERVGALLERCPNLVIETGARVPEIGRHDADEMRAFFERFQDRILFGTDLGVNPGGLMLGSTGPEPATEEQVPFFFDAHWRYFETRGRGMNHPTPIQGDWTIDGIGLDAGVLRKLYRDNAIRVFGLPDGEGPPD